MFEPGNQLAVGRSKPKLIHDALLREIKQNPEKLAKAITAQLNAAQDGDLDALDWIACRLEGKPAQSLTVSGDDDKPLITMIRMVVISQHESDSLTLEHEPAIPLITKEITPQSQDEQTPLPHPPHAGHFG